MNYSFRQIEPYVFEVDDPCCKNMIPARLITSPDLLKNIQNDNAIKQLINTTYLPGVINYSIAMPDIHQGYGFPIGAVVATDPDQGVISPGGVGYDINCGVRLLKLNILRKEIQPYLEEFLKQLYQSIPSGFGQNQKKSMSLKQMNQTLVNGAMEIVLIDGFKDDLDSIESGGKISDVDPQYVSLKAKQRGISQLGTLGSGNHFLEIQMVDQIFNPGLAKKWGIALNQVMIMIHTGSRGVGHQTCIDYVQLMINHLNQWNISLPDRELACAPLNSPEGQNYFMAMNACANFAWANRQKITSQIRTVWQKMTQDKKESIQVIYDVAHNLAKLEKHTIDQNIVNLCVHRKGATRSFPMGHPELSAKYQETGQPVIIPGSMGTASYLLVGEPLSMQLSYGTVCHGAGRVMSRHQAKKLTTGYETLARLQNQNILVQTGSKKGLAEEDPMVYKNIHNVVQVIHDKKMATKVVRLKPIAVIKG